MLQHNANQIKSSERQFTSDEVDTNNRRLDVIRAAALAKLTEVARGINPEANNTRANNAGAQPDTYQVNGNVINAAALFAHNKRVAEEENTEKQLAKEHDARDAIAEARNPSTESSNNTVIEAAERFQPKAVEVDPEQRAFQDSSRDAVLAAFDSSANKRAA